MHCSQHLLKCSEARDPRSRTAILMMRRHLWHSESSDVDANLYGYKSRVESEVRAMDSSEELLQHVFLSGRFTEASQLAHRKLIEERKR